MRKNENDGESTACVHDSCPLKQSGEQKVQQQEGMTITGGEMVRGTHVQVWMFPGGAWDKEDAGRVWTWWRGWSG